MIDYTALFKRKMIGRSFPVVTDLERGVKRDFCFAWRALNDPLRTRGWILDADETNPTIPGDGGNQDWFAPQPNRTETWAPHKSTARTANTKQMFGVGSQVGGEGQDAVGSIKIVWGSPIPNGMAGLLPPQYGPQNPPPAESCDMSMFLPYVYVQRSRSRYFNEPSLINGNPDLKYPWVTYVQNTVAKENFALAYIPPSYYSEINNVMERALGALPGASWSDVAGAGISIERKEAPNGMVVMYRDPGFSILTFQSTVTALDYRHTTGN
jgi:hypothetical protein